jgi:hypothetical protein
LFKYTVNNNLYSYFKYICLKQKYNIKGSSTSNWQAINILKKQLEYKTEKILQIIVVVATKLACLQKQ